jgi:predicted Zn-dependent peptidase
MVRNTLRLLCLACLSVLLPAQNLQEFEKNVTEFTLANGLHFIVLERHDAPVVSVHAYVNSGSVDDPRGRTGLAHMFEHMIGKGTTTIGTKNWPEEKKALEAVEAIYDRLEAERAKGFRKDAKVIEKLEAELKQAIDKANQYVVPNEYVRIIEENGGSGFNASTANDYTNYYYDLPSNRMELWFLMQSQWMRQPIYREFYKERDVVREERRMRIESSPQGKLQEMLLATAFTAHPYRTSIGWASDIENLRAEDAQQFFLKHYVPGNITIAIAGDVNPTEVKRLADQYFSSLPSGPVPGPVVTEEPPQEGEKRVAVETAAQPFDYIAYKRPNQLHEDDVVFDVIANIVSSGRTGLLYKELVRDKKIALGAAAGATFPSGKYDSLFVFLAVPNQGKSVEENEKAIYEIVERLKNEQVDATTLDRVKTKLRAGLIRQLDSNSGLAYQLAFYEANYGDWRKMFTGLDEIDKVTADDVQRVARKYFKTSSSTVAHTVAPPKPSTTQSEAK